MSVANDLLGVYNNLNNKLVEQSELITQISEALVGKITPPSTSAKIEQEKIVNTQAYTDTSVVVEPDDGKTLSKVTVNIDVKEEQEKVVNVTSNGSQTIVPDNEKVLSKVTINTNISTKEEQEKSIEITSNGTQVVLPDTDKTLSKVIVTANIESSGSGNGDITEERMKWINRSWTEFNDDEITVVQRYVFAYCDSLTSIDLPVCISVGNYAFAYCTSLTSINLPMCDYVGQYAFTMCSSLTSINLPMCDYVGNYVFRECTSLTSLTLGYSSVAKLNNINAFNSTPMSISTLTGSFGSIYVPASLVDAYKSATNWATYADRITAIVE